MVPTQGHTYAFCQSIPARQATESVFKNLLLTETKDETTMERGRLILVHLFIAS
jgi:hypothetical protein